MLLKEIENLMALEISSKDAELLKYFYPDHCLNTFRKTFIEEAIRFCEGNDLFLFFQNIPTTLSEDDINRFLIMINFLQSLPLKLPVIFIQNLVHLEKEELVKRYPNFYCFSDEDYLLKRKAELLKMKQNLMFSKKMI